MAANTVDRARSWNSLIDEACINTRGYPNGPGNPYTTFPQMEAGMDAWQLDYELTYDFTLAQASPWSIVLCSGALLRLVDGSAFYPDSWFHGYSPDHFILWGPQYQGSGAWIMNPLSYYPGDTWAQIDLDTLAGGFGGAYILSGLPTPEAEQPEQPPQLEPAYCTLNRQAGLKEDPAHGGQDIWTIPAGARAYDTGIRAYDASTPPDPDLRWARLGYSPTPDDWFEGYVEGNTKTFTREDA